MRRLRPSLISISIVWAMVAACASGRSDDGTGGTGGTGGSAGGGGSAGTGGGGICGDGIVDAGEQCDGTNLAGSTCEAQGFDGGTLACGDNCTFNTDDCTACGDDSRKTRNHLISLFFFLLS